MRYALLALFLTVSGAFAQETDFMENRWVAILSVYPKFADARADAEKIARESGRPFSMEGRVFDKKRGLIYPENFEDETFAGGYVARRFNETLINEKETPYLSVERSDGYDGFKPGYYIVVAGIFENAKDAQDCVKKFTAWAPTAYAKKTKIYMGCLH
jgi:hypothetical protein